MYSKYPIVNRSFALAVLVLFTSHAGAANQIGCVQLIKHVQLLQDLKNKFAEKSQPAQVKLPTRKTSSTQTDAYLRLYGAELKSMHPGWFAKYQTIINTCLERERELVDSHYVLYHGQKNELSILQDVLKLLYELLYIHAPIKNYEIMRAWHEAAEALDIDGYLASGKNDAKDYFCANLSLFGNHINPACNLSCSFYYFAANYNMAPVKIENFLTRLCDGLGLNKKYVAQILDLAKKIQTPEGRLFQVFIPREKIDSCTFLSACYLEPYSKIIIKEEYDYALGRHRRISPIIELYKKNPGAISRIDELQARVMCSKNLLLNPDSGVRIYTYTTIEQEKFKQYQKELRSLVERMVSEWISTQSMYKAPFSVTSEMPLFRLINFLRRG